MDIQDLNDATARHDLYKHAPLQALRSMKTIHSKSTAEDYLSQKELNANTGFTDFLRNSGQYGVLGRQFEKKPGGLFTDTEYLKSNDLVGLWKKYHDKIYSNVRSTSEYTKRKLGLVV